MKKAIRWIWKTICYPLLYVAIQVLLLMVWAIVIGVSVAINILEEGRAVSVEEMTAYITAMLSGGINYAWLIMISCMLTFLIMWLILRKEWKSVRFWKVSELTVYTVVLCALLGPPLSLFSSGAVYFTQLTKIFPGYEQLITSVLGHNLWLELIASALIAPVVEEIIFRGTILRRLKNTFMKLPLALVIQALLFAVTHGNVVQGIYAFILGIILGLVYIWFDSIWAPVAMHVTFNLFGVAISFLPVVVETEISDGVFAGLTVVALVVSMGLGWLTWRRCSKKVASKTT